MASIGGLSSSTSNSIGSTSLRGYGGLASGLDRDTLIENMTYGTTSKITQQQQKKQQLEWKQEAIRSITDKMIAFGNKYTTTLTSSTNLFNSNFWGRNKITASGDNSKYVALSGTASSANALTISAVKQLAQKATVSSESKAADRALTTGVIDTTKDYSTQNLVGKTIAIQEGNNGGDGIYSLVLAEKDKDGNTLKYDSAEEIAKSINKLLEDANNDDAVKMKELLDVSYDAASGQIQITGKCPNVVSLSGGTALETLGLEEGKEIQGQTVTTNITEADLVTQRGFSDMINGKTLTFNYNGTSKNITLTGTNDLDKLAESIQKELNSAFGKGRISVEAANGGLSFKTMDPKTNDVDTSSTLSITGGGSGLLGEGGALNVNSGASNRLNLDSPIGASGLDLSGLKKGTAADTGETTYTFYINNGKLTTEEGGTAITLTENDTVNTLMKRISENTDMNVTYQSASDKFTFTSKENGASGTIAMDEKMAEMFGIAHQAGQGVEIQGQDAVVAVKYAGSDEIIELHRDSNTFTIDGLTVAVKGEFGYKENGEIDKEAAVSISASVDEDKIVDNIKSMIEEYNAIVAEVNSQLTTKHDKDYAPLTSDQRKELSESEIKNYEEKAKEGLLFGDSDLRMLSSSLRTVMSGGLIEEFKKIGITTSSSYSDNGKLELDETTLRSALATNPENVERLFTSTKGVNADGTASYNGLATNLKSVIHQYSNPLGSSESKGVLVRKAGTSHSVMSLTDNEIYQQLQQINKMISSLQDRLQTERDRYISQFTSLETLISQMNAQSGWLSSFS